MSLKVSSSFSNIVSLCSNKHSLFDINNRHSFPPVQGFPFYFKYFREQNLHKMAHNVTSREAVLPGHLAGIAAESTLNLLKLIKSTDKGVRCVKEHHKGTLYDLESLFRWIAASPHVQQPAVAAEINDCRSLLGQCVSALKIVDDDDDDDTDCGPRQAKFWSWKFRTLWNDYLVHCDLACLARQ